MGRAAFLDLAEENDFLPHLLHRHVEVLHARENAFQVVQFVIMGGKEGFGAAGILVSDEFQHRPGDGKAIVGAGPAPDLV